MKRKVLWLLAFCFLASIRLVESQQTGKFFRIGYLTSGSPPDPAQPASPVTGFRQALRELGYLDGENIVIEYRFADGKLDRLPEMATELVQANVAVIVTTGTPATQAARKATGTIPIVVGTAGDLVGSGLLASLPARADRVIK